MYRLAICFFLPIFNALVTVQIHQKSFYQRHSSCAFIRNASFSNAASIQSCVWECDYEHDCQTAVYFHDEKNCSMFAELCITGSIQPSGSGRASVICYRKNHEPLITCSSTSTLNQRPEEETAASHVITSTDQVTPVGIYALTIPACATWNQTGMTVAGNNNGSLGTDLTSLSSPTTIFLDNNDLLYIADRDNHRIVKYYPNSTAGIMVAGNGTAGNESNQLRGLKGVAIDQSGAIIVADSDNYRIQKFPFGSAIGITLASNTLSNPLGEMRDLHIDVNNNIYVTDSNYNRIDKYISSSSDETIIAGGGTAGSAANQLSSPHGNFMDANNTLYVADYGNARIMKYASGLLNGTMVAGNGIAGLALNQLSSP